MGGGLHWTGGATTGDGRSRSALHSPPSQLHRNPAPLHSLIILLNGQPNHFRQVGEPRRATAAAAAAGQQWRAAS